MISYGCELFITKTLIAVVSSFLKFRIDELCQKKFELECDFIQLICEVLDQSERDKLVYT